MPQVILEESENGNPSLASVVNKSASMFTFKLTDDFVEGYKNKKAPFGYRDAGGNSVGEITFLRTYSRMKEDATKETWVEVCERVINGMYSLQKDHCKKNRLPWNDAKGQASAKEAFDRLFNLKWSPPGRGLWVMGTNIVNMQKNSAALQNCFRGSEKFITKEFGAISFLDTLGDDVTVLTKSGWNKASIRSFGKQNVQRVTFGPANSNPRGPGVRLSRSNHRVDIVVTPNHKWVLEDGSETTSLAVGDSIPALATPSFIDTEEYTNGIRHGLIFGDGTAGYTYADGSREFHIRLCGERMKHYISYFNNINLTVPSYNGDPWCRLRSFINLKDFPITGSSVEYLQGFLDGWIAADAAIGVQADAWILTSQHVGAKNWLEDNAATAGYLLRGINQDPIMETNFGIRHNPMYRYTLLPKPSFWKVTSIETLEELEEVFCATVDGVGAFTLASGIYTGNCAFVSTADMSKFNPTKPFTFLMEASMLGVGVGFDDKGADKDFTIYEPKEKTTIVISDTREGWVDSLSLVLSSYLKENQPTYEFDYSQIRPLGTPIKTFGGTASGPEPLMKLHAQIRKLFLGRAGEKLTRIDIADIGNLIGVCVVSGNVRRSAELLVGRLDDDNFLNLKNKDVFPERNSYDIVDPGWGWMSNNSVETTVGSDLSRIIDGIALNGEPGVLWMDLARKYGRLADPENNKDKRVAGFNPSLIAGTKIYTTEGIRDINSLEGKTFVIKNLNGKLSEAKCWKSGTNVPIYTLNLAGGHSYGATKEHKWPVWNGKSWIKKTTLELQPGDLLPNLVQNTMFPEGTRGTYDEGFLIGWNLGDGWQTDKKDNRRPDADSRRQYGFIVSDNDRKSGIHKKLVSALTSLGVSTEMNIKEEINVSHHGIRDLFDSLGVHHKTVGLPKEVWESDVSDEFRKGLIDALYSSDGTIDEGRICFSQASKIMVDEVSSLLGFFGIKTNKGTVTRSRTEAFPNSYTDDGSTFTRYTLRIGSIDNIKNFSKIFTLSHKDKQDKINEICSRNNNLKDKTNYIEVTSVADGGTADVWDVTVFDDTHAFQIDHCITGNCAEQSLESYEMCTLVETYLNRHESLEDYKRTLKFAYLYAKTVTLLPTHWEETNAIMQRNRRIGASMSGVANFADRVGIPVLKEWMDQGYKTIQRYDNIYSEWMGIRESIKMTTIKPSGTVSILAGESPGVHWTPGGKYFNRTIRFSNTEPMLELFKMANYRIEKDVTDVENTSVVYFPIKSEAARAEKDVTIFEKMSLAATAQRYWSDNSVSVTISFDTETEAKHVGTVLHMYDGQLKTVSFLPSGNDTYPQMPYTQITEEEYNEALQRLFPIDFSGVYAGMALDAIGENYCTTDSCEIKFIKDNTKI